ncbi:hypothetical protein SAMN05660199_02021 [Klenkia soli]|uniref:DUF5313 domain-containing protein n=1 Tax=Klenkia soli TaxID=1052260 RepID=A0A1H0JN74_9ACTN|nr:DUF5313 family protein [Klenkia soli]SDO45044.1 hypothetical protein SAMN05660199_02021 [Klenkia soli]
MAHRRPNPVQWTWYALGGGLPPAFKDWVLADTTGPGWARRHLLRAVVQLTPVLVAVLLVVPVPLAYRVSACGGGVLLGLLFSAAYMTETSEHRAVKAGWPPGTTRRIREARAERRAVERGARYRQDGAGSYD